MSKLYTHGWNRSGIADWVDQENAYVSVVFSWSLKKARKTVLDYAKKGYRVYVGGPAVAYHPEILADIAERWLPESGADYPDAIVKHNPNATFTSRGCLRKCSFCIVPKIEGELVELKDWPVRPIVCDNNLLACSRAHFDSVIDKLRGVKNVDFNQGLDARLLKPYHACRLAELDAYVIRLAWDHIEMESVFLRAYQTLINAGISARKIRVYVLIGFNDTPEDALYRLETIWKLGSFPNPMRYQPLDALTKNSYVGANWTDKELKRYAKYWSRLAYYHFIPFDQFDTQYVTKRNRALRSVE